MKSGDGARNRASSTVLAVSPAIRKQRESPRNFRIADNPLRIGTAVESSSVYEMTAKLELDRNEVDLLAWNIANEVVNGFAVDDFTRTIGAPLEVFKQIASRLRSVDCENAVVTLTEAAAFRNALALTLNELSEDEFHTRTGHSFEEGNLILARLNRSLGDQ